MKKIENLKFSTLRKGNSIFFLIFCASYKYQILSNISKMLKQKTQYAFYSYVAV